MLNSDNPKLVGDAYKQGMLSGRADRLARSAFQNAVARILKPGATIFDFGAGTGIDARFYADRGYRVIAYDQDPQMCEAFRRDCGHALASNQVELVERDYRSFLACYTALPGHQVDLVTANFAPLNLIENVNELFGKLHALTVPRGRILASVLSPTFLGDMRYRWWWRNRTQLRRQGHYTVGGVWTVTRRVPTDFAALAAPYFGLAGVGRGLPGSPLRRAGSPLLLLPLATSRYMFLLFEKS